MKTIKGNLKMSASAKINKVQQARENKMMSKAELARKAGVTVQTIDRIERGYECRLATKRKIILALGYQLAERSEVFDPSENQDTNEISGESSTNPSEEEGHGAIPRKEERVRVLRKKVPATQ